MGNGEWEMGEWERDFPLFPTTAAKSNPALGALADVTSTAWPVLSLEIRIRVGELLNCIHPLIAAYCRLLPHWKTHEPG